jgi:hypothetical protein
VQVGEERRVLLRRGRDRQLLHQRTGVHGFEQHGAPVGGEHGRHPAARRELAQHLGFLAHGVGVRRELEDRRAALVLTAQHDGGVAGLELRADGQSPVRRQGGDAVGQLRHPAVRALAETGFEPGGDRLEVEQRDHS